MSELLDMKRRAISLGLCGEYKRLWDGAASKRELMDIALDPNGISFLCDGFEFGWGLRKEYLLDEFGGYVNGRYVSRHKNGSGEYTSEMYVLMEGIEISARSSLLLIAGCKCDVLIGASGYSEIHVCSGSDVTLHCEGHCVVNIYGDSSKVSVKGKGDTRIETVKRSLWINR